MEVHGESTEFLTIDSLRGLFQYTRSPFSIKTAPIVYQQVMYAMLVGIPGVAVDLNNIIVIGSNKSELTGRLHQVLHRMMGYAFRLREESTYSSCIQSSTLCFSWTEMAIRSC